MPPRPQGLILAGPTGSGKSALALELGTRQDSVIINADSLQLYEGLPLLTAQPSAADHAQVPHRLYGVFEPVAPLVSAGQWCGMVARLLGVPWETGQTPPLPPVSLPPIEPHVRPIVVGGTGFYLHALTQGLCAIPQVPQHILDGVQTLTVTTAYANLQAIDPVVAAKLQPTDRQRIFRALSVWYATGKRLSEWHTSPRIPLPLKFQVTYVCPPPPVLGQRLKHRLGTMVENGIFEEVRAFLDRFSQESQDSSPESSPDSAEKLKAAPVTRALGFKEIHQFWKGDLTRDQAIEKIFHRTCQYAKRQMTWFRHQKI